MMSFPNRLGNDFYVISYTSSHDVTNTSTYFFKEITQYVCVCLKAVLS